MYERDKTIIKTLLLVMVGSVTLFTSAIYLASKNEDESPYKSEAAKVNRNLSITEDADYPDTVLVFRNEGDVYINKLHNEDNKTTKQ